MSPPTSHFNFLLVALAAASTVSASRSTQIRESNLKTRVDTRTFTFVNNCGYTLYPAITNLDSSEGYTGSRGWEAVAGSSNSVSVPNTWNGRTWVRRDCSFTGSTGTCVSGDSGGGLEPTDYTYGTGINIGEFNLIAGSSLDWGLFLRSPPHWDVSAVMGFNVPVSIVPDGCTGATCSTDLTTTCPSELAIYNAAGQVIECRQACFANYDLTPSASDCVDCCSGSYNTAATCPIANYDFYSFFKDGCPNAYAMPIRPYASNFGLDFDDVNGATSVVQVCSATNSPGYTITLCIAAEHVEVLVTSLAIVLLLAPLVVFEILLTALARAASQKSSLAWSAVSERAHTNGWISGDRTSAIWLGIKRLLHQRRVGATGPEKEVVEEGGASEDGPEEIAVMGLSGENLEEEATALESNRPNGEPERPGAGLEGLSSERNETWGHLVPEIEAAYLPSTTQVSVLETITPLDTALEVAGGEPALLPTLEKHGVGPNHSFENPDYNSVKSGDSPSAVNLDGYPVTPVSSPTNICLPGFPPSPDSESSTEVVDAACTDDNASVSVTSSNDYSTMDSPKKKRKMTFSARAKTLFGSKPTMKV